jgi:carboxyl-terminal processing protease
MDKKENTKIRNQKILIGVVILTSFVVGWFFGAQDAKLSQIGFTPKLIERDLSESKADFSIFWRAWDLLVEKYDGEVDYKAMIYGAIRGMTEALGDPYTAFMSPEEARALDSELSGVIYGIGAEIGIKNNQLTVISPLNESPAEKSGLITGDIILAIDGETTQKMSVDEAVFKIRGEEGTEVKLSIKRGDVIKDYQIKRAKITIESVKHETLNKDVGLITVSRFDEKTTAKTRQALDDFISQNIKKIIIDLRNNPGGYLDESISFSSEFLKEGIVVTEKKDIENGDKSYEYKASGKGKATGNEFKIIVLINEGSASAAEIVAGALKDYSRATLVGETTFGKGSVQEIENLSGGAKLRITIAHWYTPKGQNIGKKGIEPDHEIELTEDDYNNDRDPQLNKALELLK